MSNESLNMAEIRKLMEQEAALARANGETPVVGGMDWAKNVSEEPETQKAPATTEEMIDQGEPVVEAPTADYSGPGLVIEKEKEIPDGIMYTGIAPDVQKHIDEYMAEMDNAIEEAKKNAEAAAEEQAVAGEVEEPQRNKTEEEEFNESYEEAVVVIDKSGMGRVINFTDEEREKMTRSKTIKLNEIEVVPLSTFNTKKLKNPKNFNRLIKSVNTVHSTPVVLPLSGYTATIKGCTAYELMSLLETGNNALLDAQAKWSLIHSKIVSTSIGDMDFNTFLFNTAAADYNTLIYGILCATYPETDTTGIKCHDCKTTHEHTYSVRQLIRAERMSERLMDQFTKIADASVSLDEALKVHNDSPIKFVKGIRLPVSGIIVEIQVQSAYDLINNSIKSLDTGNEIDDNKFKSATVIATLIKRALVEDPEDPDSAYEFTNSREIAEIIYQLRERDILVIKKFGDDLMGDMTIDYGFMNIKCPECGRYIPFMTVDPEQLLFQRYRQELNANIE